MHCSIIPESRLVFVSNSTICTISLVTCYWIQFLERRLSLLNIWCSQLTYYYFYVSFHFLSFFFHLNFGSFFLRYSVFGELNSSINMCWKTNKDNENLLWNSNQNQFQQIFPFFTCIWNTECGWNWWQKFDGKPLMHWMIRYFWGFRV